MINLTIRSPRLQVGGLSYFGRMLDKIRLHLAGNLPADYQENFGATRSLDGILSRFLDLRHEEIVARVRQGGTDEEILEWCFLQGHRPNETQAFVWNTFAEKLGWRDRAAATVERVQALLGPEGPRIATIFECIEADEGRLERQEAKPANGQP